MPVSQQKIGPQTPMGATIVPGQGVTFRVWAPAAVAVYVCGDFNGWTQNQQSLLVNDGSGIWAGFVPGIGEGVQYKFFIVGRGSSGYKRDPRAP